MAPLGFVVLEISWPSLHLFAFLDCVGLWGGQYDVTGSVSSWKLRGACKAVQDWPAPVVCRRVIESVRERALWRVEGWSEAVGLCT